MNLAEVATALAEVLDTWHVTGDEYGETRCCKGTPDYGAIPVDDPDYDVQRIIEHVPSCPYMRAHALLNKSTFHRHEVHAWKAT